MVLDSAGKLWVLSDGGYAGSPAGQENGALTCIDPDGFIIEKTITFPDIESSPKKLCTDNSGQNLYFLHGTWEAGSISGSGVYKMKISDEQIPVRPFIPEGDALFYGLGIDPANSDIYVSDALDYLQRGMVYRYSSDGSPQGEFRAGIIPGAFCFKR